MEIIQPHVNAQYNRRSCESPQTEYRKGKWETKCYQPATRKSDRVRPKKSKHDSVEGDLQSHSDDAFSNSSAPPTFCENYYRIPSLYYCFDFSIGTSYT